MTIIKKDIIVNNNNNNKINKKSSSIINNKQQYQNKNPVRQFSNNNKITIFTTIIMSLTILFGCTLKQSTAFLFVIPSTTTTKRTAFALARRTLPYLHYSSTTSTSTSTSTSALTFTNRLFSSSSSTTTTSRSSQSTTTSISSTRTSTSTTSSLMDSPNTGGLRRLPVVKGPVELFDKAKKVPLRIKADASMKNARNRAKKHGAERLNALTQALCIPLRDIVNGYRTELRRLHPFERVVADLTIRARQKKDGFTLDDVLKELHESRKMILEASKEWIYKVKQAETAKDANSYTSEGIDKLLSMYQEFAFEPIAGILELQQGLRSAPAVQLDTPAVVLVGAPNVGKSSIVRFISSATPEVNNYPFTTRGMTLGHVEVFWDDQNTIAKAIVPKGGGKKSSLSSSDIISTNKYAFSQLCQVMDSPGILVRPENEKRNEMEELTLAAMKHLPTAVMYVMDLSGQAGDKCSSVQDQLQLRKEIRARFPRRPWIDVVSKYDLGTVDGALEELEEILDGSPYIKLSIHDGLGIDELREEVLRMLGEVRVVLDAMAAATAAAATDEQRSH